MIIIRTATSADASAIWPILEAVFRAGETYKIRRDIDEADAIAYWCGRNHETFVAEDNSNILGTYFLRAIRTWEAYGFAKVGRLPLSVRHPALGFVDAFVMYKQL